MTKFKVGQLVRVKSLCLAYGRVAMVMSVLDSIQVRFADLPKSVATEPNPDGFVQRFSPKDLEVIEGIPVAVFYLLVTVLTLVGIQEHKQYAIPLEGCAIAHGNIGQKPEDVAETAAACFFSSLGDWDGEFYLREQSPYASKLLSYEEITMADYITLSRTTPDYDLGVCDGCKQ